ncbi:hypothetical protein [[Mycoplasma] testudinis]|uniref:hypothetical protein n=1 Tax=[Mycoplasma] testudinis TaxID=33924 RepID=UPI0004813984|nr:hypothetical protein [[Mycoplasma] testudinis]
MKSDFIKKIADRTISLQWSYAGFSDNNWKAHYDIIKRNVNIWNTDPSVASSKNSPFFWNTYFVSNDQSGRNFSLPKFTSGGTAWIVDRIFNTPEEQAHPDTPQNEYSFIMATNKHVANIADRAGANPIAYGTHNNAFPDVQQYIDFNVWATLWLQGLNRQYYHGQTTLTPSNFEQMYQTIPGASDSDKQGLINNWNDWKNKFIPQNQTKVQNALNKEKSWLANSGFDDFVWQRFSPQNDDYTNVSNVPSSDVRAAGKVTPAEQAGYKYQNQILYGDDTAWNPVTNINVDYYKGITEWKSKTAMRQTYNINDFNFTPDQPSWLIQSRQKFLDSIIYAPTETIGHIYRGASSSAQGNLIGGPGLRRETQQDMYTNHLMGADLAFMKMTFNATDLARDWKPLYDVLHEKSPEQQKWFAGAVSATPRTDDRTTTYVAGYPATDSTNGVNRIFSYRVANNTSAFSMDPGYSDSGTGNVLQAYYIKYDPALWNEYYEPYSYGGKYNHNYHQFPTDPVVSNKDVGLWMSTSYGVSTFIQSGDSANPGNSGSMVIDANFNNFGILFAFGPIGGTDHTLINSFVGLDPYSKSNVLPSGRSNARLELAKILRDEKISTFNISK